MEVYALELYVDTVLFTYSIYASKGEAVKESKRMKKASGNINNVTTVIKKHRIK
jgi:methyl-accepting chemotaxis protein